MPPVADLVIVGGGVIGLTTALALRERQPGASVVVLEKEEATGSHASGRNSGVLHAGFAYGDDTLKARLCREGNRRLAAWCEARGLTVRRCGKLVVARSESDHPAMDELLRRAGAAGVELHPLDVREARAIEPRVRTVGRALFSPSTASVSPAAVMSALTREAVGRGVRVITGCRWLGVRGRTLSTSTGALEAGFVVNAAGLFADRVAAAFGFGQGYRVVPFKGLYLLGGPSAGPLACHVYPVPRLGMPFLGVHATVTADGGVKIGPTALPAWWRENYGGLAGLEVKDLFEVLARDARMFLFDPEFRRHGLRELRQASRTRMVAEAAALLDGVRADDFPRWGRPGIRAQLYDVTRGRLEMDFVLEGDERSLHVLNAVSPAFTCSLPFADLVADRVLATAGG